MRMAIIMNPEEPTPMQTEDADIDRNAANTVRASIHGADTWTAVTGTDQIRSMAVEKHLLTITGR